MTELVNGFLNNLGPGGVAEIAQSLGVSDEQAGSAVAAALPALLGGMANNATKPEGAVALSNALDGHSPSIFDSLGGLLTGGGDGAKILGHVLGARQGGVAQHVASQRGLSTNLILQLLPILAPLVRGYLSKQKQSQGLDAGGLGSMLGQERQAAEAAQPGLGGLAAILDSDGDGSLVDDILGHITGQ